MLHPNLNFSDIWESLKSHIDIFDNLLSLFSCCKLTNKFTENRKNNLI